MLFEIPGKDPLYELIRTRNNKQDQKAKAYWNGIYSKIQQFLDHNFKIELSNDFMARLWELKVASYLKMLSESHILNLNEFKTKKSAPDFCISLNDQTFYIECVTASPGTVDSLKHPLTSTPICRSTPRTEYKERITQAINEKVIIKYNGKKSDGYKHIMDDAGLIIALSSAKIEIPNHPYDSLLDLSCLFGISERNMDVKTGELFYEFQPEFRKKSTGNPIPSTFFLDEKYSYISGIIVSHHAHVFYPEYEEFNWPKSKNDFILIHNPNAKKRIPSQYFPVQEEYETTIDNNLVRISQLVPVEHSTIKSDVEEVPA
ncbi:hypothetical protein [Legionella sp. CNM-4043-24]|uniref:hypothetical protein n=1 Tax=Legionella sp. CNM-4043-24 TaxID=3421646 RepID=UPI00403AA361